MENMVLNPIIRMDSMDKVWRVIIFNGDSMVELVCRLSRDGMESDTFIEI